MSEYKSSHALKLHIAPTRQQDPNCKSKCESRFLANLFTLTEFSAESSDISGYLNFVLDQALDCLSPISAALWEMSNELGWALVSSVGSEMALPPAWKVWPDLNRECFKRHRVTLIPTDSVTARFQKPVHWAIPAVVVGEKCYVFHVVGLTVPHCPSLLEPFLRTVAQNVAHFSMSQQSGCANETAHKPIILGATMSYRQKEILSFLALDLTYHQISKRMGFSESTIKQEAMKIFRILGVANRVEAVRGINTRVDAIQRV